MRNLMSDLRKGVLGLCVISMGLGVSVPAQAASANGPYYATPSWDQKLDANTRFIVLSNWNSEAVLDRETGLVWERSPSTSTFLWANASLHCMDLNAGGRAGWRLPTVQELLSLVDRSVPFPGPALPSGHPFSNVQSGVFSDYWSATALDSNGDLAWQVRLGSGRPAGATNKLFALPTFAWCVRGGQSPDAQ